MCLTAVWRVEGRTERISRGVRRLVGTCPARIRNRPPGLALFLFRGLRREPGGQLCVAPLARKIGRGLAQVALYVRIGAMG